MAVGSAIGARCGQNVGSNCGAKLHGSLGNPKALNAEGSGHRVLIVGPSCMGAWETLNPKRRAGGRYWCTGRYWSTGRYWPAAYARQLEYSMTND
jgi:hypothetical protein